MESGTPGIKSTEDGWLNRALQAEDLRHNQRTHCLSRPCARLRCSPHPGRQDSRHRAHQRQRLHRSRPRPRCLSRRQRLRGHVRRAAATAFFHAAGDETFEAVKMLRAANPAQYTPGPGVDYPTTEFGNNMKQIAQLLKANLGVEAAFTDVSGWDTHQNQGSVNGQLANRLARLLHRASPPSGATSATAQNTSPSSPCQNSAAPPARTAPAAPTTATPTPCSFSVDNVKGGKVYGHWPGLDNEQLNEGRDLVLTTDFRQVLGEVVAKTLGAGNLETVFPGARLPPESLPAPGLASSFSACRTSPSHPCAAPAGSTRAYRTYARPDTHAPPPA